MKGLTLTQPWATLVALGAKRFETRSWSTGYRGPLAIHAAKGLGPVGGKDGLWRITGTEPFQSALAGAGPLPLGLIVAVVDLVDVLPTEEALARYVIAGTDEESFGDYSNGRFAWKLTNVRPVRVPYRGALGLWDASKAGVTP